MDQSKIDRAEAAVVMPATSEAQSTPSTLWGWVFIGVVVSLWVVSTLTFGFPGFYMPAVIAAPFMVVALVLITAGM